MNPVIPAVGAVAGAVVLLAQVFFDVALVPETVEKVLNAIAVLVVAGSGVWAWFRVKFLEKQVASLSPKVPAKKKKRKE